MQLPLVSVIIPVFNTGNSCIKLLKSLQRSTYKNIEIICIDDGSEDDSYKTIHNFSKKYDNIIVKRQKNSGASAARNAGVKIASGSFISFIDSDDEVDKTFIAKLVDAFSDNTILVCTSLLYRRLASNDSYMDFTKRMRPRRASESVKEYVCYAMLLDGRLYGSVNKLFRRDIIEKNNVSFDVTMNFAEDTKFVLDYIAAAIDEYPNDCCIKTIYEPLYVYNFGTNTSTVLKSSLDWDNWKKSYNHLNVWSSDNRSVVMKFRKLLIWLRWRVSHALSVARSNLSVHEKRLYCSYIELFFANILVNIRK